MRFSLRTLLLLPFAFVIAVLLSIAYENTINLKLSVYRHDQAFRRLQSIYMRSQSRHERFSSKEISATTIDRWLRLRISPCNHEYEPIEDLLGEWQGDGWDRPFRLVTNVTLPTGENVAEGIYSLGLDGVSATGGNDPDDINSWNPNCLQYYHDLIAAEERQTHTTRAIFLTPIVFGGMLLLGCFRQYLRSCQSPDFRSSS